MATLPTLPKQYDRIRGIPGLQETLHSFFDDRFEDTFAQVASQFFGDNVITSSKEPFPPYDIIEKKTCDEYHFTIPGWKKENISIDYNQGYLIVKGEKVLVEGTRIRKGIKRSAWTRSVKLDDSKYIDKDIVATIKDGVLIVTFTLKEPRQEQKEDVLHIPIV